MDELTAQQQLVLEQRYKALDMMDRANDAIDSKSLGLLQASALIITLTGVLSIPTILKDTTTVWAFVGLTVAFGAFVAMIIVSVKAWLPGDYQMPGNPDRTNIRDMYLDAGVNDCYLRTLANTIKSFEGLAENNKRKACLTRISVYLFIAQIVGLFILALV